MAHRSEQGNVLGFVLVGALLVASLLGGIYVVRHNIAGQAGTDVANNDQSETSTTTDPDKAQNDTTAPDASGDGQSDQALEDALNEQSSSKGQQNSSNTGNSSPTSQTQALPETGPADTLAAMLGATLLVGASFSYARSRRLI